MAVGINIPKRQQRDDLGNMLQIGGAVAGGIATGGSPQGIAAGAGIGKTVGGAITPEAPQGPQAVDTGGGGAMGRRMQSLDQSPLRQIREGINSLQFVQDPGQRAALAQPLMMADQAARRGGRV